MADEKQNGGLVDAARNVGSTVGKVVSAVTGGGSGGAKQADAPKPSGASAPTAAKADAPQPENLWQAEYQGSGTFIIHKPKRSSRKRHSQMVRNRRRGMRTF